MKNIGSEMAWAEERRAVTQAAYAASKKGAKIERDRIKKGWRWVKVGKQTQTLVPCDKNGEPTEKGIIMIERMKTILGIK